MCSPAYATRLAASQLSPGWLLYKGTEFSTNAIGYMLALSTHSVAALIGKACSFSPEPGEVTEAHL